MTTRVGVNGFGRIGRSFFRVVLEQDADIEIVAINDLADTKTLAHLFKYDPILGCFGGEASYDESLVVVNGRAVKVLAQRNLVNLLRGELSVDVVIESIGLLTGGEKARAHPKAGTKKVVISAPVENVNGTFVMDVNEGDYDGETVNIISNVSCTINCLAPPTKALHANFGVAHDIMTTIYSYIDSQRVLNAPYSNLRRARAVALNMIPTKTGTAQTVALVLLELKGKFDGLVVCVSTPTGLLTDLTPRAEKEVSVEVVNVTVRTAAEGEFKGILECMEGPIVSTGIVGNPHSPVSDVGETKIIGDLVEVLPWYDNEWGYSSHPIQLAVLVGSKLA